jgi:hypothetical protein
MRARRILTPQGTAYQYRDRDQFLRRLWVLSETSPDEVYQELERINRICGSLRETDFCQSFNRQSTPSAYWSEPGSKMIFSISFRQQDRGPRTA